MGQLPEPSAPDNDLIEAGLVIRRSRKELQESPASGLTHLLLCVSADQFPGIPGVKWVRGRSVADFQASVRSEVQMRGFFLPLPTVCHCARSEAACRAG